MYLRLTKKDLISLLKKSIQEDDNNDNNSNNNSSNESNASYEALDPFVDISNPYRNLSNMTQKDLQDFLIIDPHNYFGKYSNGIQDHHKTVLWLSALTEEYFSISNIIIFTAKRRQNYFRRHQLFQLGDRVTFSVGIFWAMNSIKSHYFYLLLLLSFLFITVFSSSIKGTLISLLRQNTIEWKLSSKLTTYLLTLPLSLIRTCNQGQAFVRPLFQ